MSSLRRVAQANHTALTSPRPPNSAASSSGASPSTPIRSSATGPTTPRTRVVYAPSPLNSPSLSASLPFDWEAVRSNAPPPYSTPNKRGRKPRHSEVGATPGKGPQRARVIRKQSLIEKIKSFPSRVIFEISLFPHNVPLPSAPTAARLIGGVMHFTHLCIRVSQERRIPDSDLGWEDMFRENEAQPWFDWTTPVGIVLIGGAVLNLMRLFTQTRLYYLTLATEPVSSPHAAFVHRPRSPSPTPSSPRTTFSIIFTIFSALWHAVVVSIRFLFNLSPPKDRQTQASRTERVQQLEVWEPGKVEMELFAIYSPVHAVLWMATGSSNWVLMLCAMAGVSFQIRVLSRAFEALLKDRTIIASEVMHEYDEKFVIPRVNPLRKDACVMTHESEMVNVWEDD